MNEEVSTLKAAGIDHQRAANYAQSAENLRGMGLTVSLEVLGPEDGTEPDGSPRVWAQVDAPPHVCHPIYQGAARNLAAFELGFGWGRQLAGA